MKKLMIMILCLLVVGVVTADAQKRKSYKVKSTQKRVVKKKVPVDSVVIFSYLEEHGVVTTGVQLRRKGNDYLLTAVEINDIRIDMERAIALSKEITSERLANGYLEMEMARGDVIRAAMIPGIETKVDKSVVDQVVSMAEKGNLQEMKSYYTRKEFEEISGGSRWKVTMQLPGKSAVSSGGRNNLGPSAVFEIFRFLYEQEVKLKRKK